ncbi:unnamed protein product [Staurois parvus]|uniref:Uncharacterized protein n=1 Tax=Staurois parvus TaxID=386267 RepID=A0ABN9FA10_9NEOB|nr:unnamed protein product [Staurois parvus]
MYIHTQTHVRTSTHIHTHIHVHTCRHVQIHTCTYTQTHVHTDTCTYINTHTHVHTHTQTHPIKSFSTLLFTHRAGCCTLDGGREHSTHSFLCFHCAQLLSSLTAPSANDRSSLSSEPAQQDGPGGHTCLHHNFHSPLASRRVEFQGLF